MQENEGQDKVVNPGIFHFVTIVPFCSKVLVHLQSFVSAKFERKLAELVKFPVLQQV